MPAWGLINAIKGCKLCLRTAKFSYSQKQTHVSKIAWVRTKKIRQDKGWERALKTWEVGKLVIFGNDERKYLVTKAWYWGVE